MVGKWLKQRRDDRLMQCASRDLARVLSGRMSGGDIQRIEGLGHRQAKYQQEFLLASHLMADLSELEGDSDLLSVVDGLETAKPARAGVHRWPLAAAAAALIMALGVVFFMPIEPVTNEQSLRYITRIGERKTVQLPDGSVITLNTDSQITVSYSDSFRDLALLKGEVYFDVAKDSARPFSVALGLRDVTVLGTQFTVRKTQEKFTLAVIEGMVSFHATNEKVSPTAQLLAVADKEVLRINHHSQRRIQANTVVEFDERTQEVVAYRDAQIDKRQSWRDGYVRFVEAPLSDVVAELNRYSAKPIMLNDATVARLQLTGTLRLDQLYTTLEGIEESLPIQIAHHRDHIEITARKN